ncbi:hypothetical protein [Prauserella muralis]|uniref:hypothetical protein n=1 Tax=Prauserella muralis TaxID=588067 RepID=UPI0011BE9E0D|nr:hypothetical protein [Prauserella muralis]
MAYPFIESESELRQISSRLHRIVDPSSSLPDWPFIPVEGEVDICEDVEFSGDDFAVALAEIAKVHRDKSLYFVTLDGGDMRPCFSLAVEEIPRGYRAAVGHEPVEELNGGSIRDAVTIFAIFGDSTKWAVWGDRNWEVLVVYSPEVRRPWRDATELEFVTAARAVDDLWPDVVRSGFREETIQRFISTMDEPRFRSR